MAARNNNQKRFEFAGLVSSSDDAYTTQTERGIGTFQTEKSAITVLDQVDVIEEVKSSELEQNDISYRDEMVETTKAEKQLAQLQNEITRQ